MRMSLLLVVSLRSYPRVLELKKFNSIDTSNLREDVTEYMTHYHTKKKSKMFLLCCVRLSTSSSYLTFGKPFRCNTGGLRTKRTLYHYYFKRVLRPGTPSEFFLCLTSRPRLLLHSMRYILTLSELRLVHETQNLIQFILE